jgi:hypothetical protein
MKAAKGFPLLVERAGETIRAGHVTTVRGRTVVTLTVDLTEDEGNSLFNGLARALYPGQAVSIRPPTESRKSLLAAGYKV